VTAHMKSHSVIGIAMAVVMAALVALAPAVSAHHSATMFEQTKTVTVEGVVKEFQYTNPHSWLLVDVKDQSGKVTTWGFEAEGPSTLQRAGIRPSEFPVGTKVTWHYRSAIGHGTVIGVHKIGTTADNTMYSIRQHDHHPGEPAVLHHSGKALSIAKS